MTVARVSDDEGCLMSKRELVPEWLHLGRPYQAPEMLRINRPCRRLVDDHGRQQCLRATV